MEYVPQKHKFRIVMSVLPLLLLCAALIAAGVYFGLLFTFIPLIVLLFAVSADKLISEAAADHVYTLYDGVFRIYVKLGKSRKKIFDLDLRYAKEAVTHAEFKKRKEKIKPSPRRRFCLCGAPRKSASLLIYYPGKRCHIAYISCNDAFFNALKTNVASYSVGADEPV